ncbi:MAG: YceI family protein [Proteobacteria bacterium]|nr:YceI family protein [Pseudomonadota bacterium]
MAGTLVLAGPEHRVVALEAELDVTHLVMASPGWTERVLGPGVFDARHYPTIRFQSELIDYGPGPAAAIAGELSLHGVARRETFRAQILEPADARAGPATVSARATTTIHRSDYGIGALGLFASDSVELSVMLEARVPAADAAPAPIERRPAATLGSAPEPSGCRDHG